MFKKNKYLRILILLGLFYPSILLARDVFNPVPNIAYKTYLFGVEDFQLRSAIMENSNLVKEEKTPPETVQILKTRAEEDLVNIQKTVANFGYYDAELDYFVDIRTAPVTVYVKVNLGPLYRIGAFKIKSEPPGNSLAEVLAQDVGRVGISLGLPAKSGTVQKATLDVVNYFQRHGYPFALLKADRVVIDRARKEMQVALLISPGNMALFGNTILQENGGVTGEFIKKRLCWKKGEVYSEKKVLETLQLLNNTRLFKEVKITHDDRVNEDGFMNIYIKLEPGQRNIFRPVAQYTPGIGGEGGAMWEHRNMAGKGDILRSILSWGKDRKIASLNYIVPDFQRVNLNLTTKAQFTKEHFKPYSLIETQIGAKVDYPFLDKIRVSGGGKFEISQLDPSSDSTHLYRYLSAPLAASYTTVEDPLAPKKGVIVHFDLIPYMRVLNRFAFFAQVDIKPHVYIPITLNEKLIGHGWANIGLTPGAGKNTVPAHKLYYAGGPDTVRGYKFQMAGPLNNGIPTGGRSLFAFGGELQYYITDPLSILAFMDVGTNYNRGFPDFRGSLMWGVGVGTRYRTEWGTLRLDVASAVKRRSVDNPVEIYFGLDHKI